MEYTETPMPAVPLAEFTTPVYRIEITVEYSFVILADHQFAFRMVNILIVQVTRRMVDVSQDVIVREIDCGTTDGLWVSEIHEGKEKIESFRERLIGRFAVGDVVNPITGKVIVPEGKMIDLYDANEIEAAGITRLKIRSLLTCRAKTGVCARCYGSDMANGEPVRLGESVGVIAAESIGEPGTQLTMRTFHTGGIASAEDITQGLPRVEELFESRRPKSMAIMSEISGVVSQDDTKKNVVIKVTGKDENGAEEVKSYSIPFTQHSRVMPGDRVEKGDIITREGVLYPQDILAIKGLEDVQNYLISEVQKVYRLQGVEINDKHIEVIVRQMCRKVRVTDSGSSNLIGGALASRLEVENINADLQKRIDAGEEGLKLVEYQQVLLGITKAALANDSFLSAASFQETTRVLTEAAIKGRRAMRMASAILAGSSSIRTTSAASMAASEPRAPMAMPTSARDKTGASLMPSPTKARFSLGCFAARSVSIWSTLSPVSSFHYFDASFPLFE